MSLSFKSVNPRSPSGKINTPRIKNNFSVKEESSPLFASTSNQTTPLLQGGVQNQTTPIRSQAKTPSEKVLIKMPEKIEEIPKDCALIMTSFLSPEDRVSLLKTNHHMKTVVEDNRNWKRYLKPELLKEIEPKKAFELYKNPENWQEKYLPTSKVGMNYLRSQYPIFSNPLVFKFVVAGKLSVEEARILTEPPPKLFGIFRNPEYRGVKNSKGVEKYIDNGKLTFQEALNLTQSQASILDDETSVQKYIDNGELTTQQAVARSHVSRFTRVYALFSLRFQRARAIGLPYSTYEHIARLFLFSVFILFLSIPLIGIKKLFSHFPSNSVMQKIGLHLPCVQKYINNNSISIDNLINDCENPTVFQFNPENLSLKSIQKRIDDSNNPFTVFDALHMSRWRAYWIAFIDFIRN